MTTPSGAIALWDVNNELGRPSTQTISMNDAAVRSLAQIGSGAISMLNLRGRSRYPALTATGTDGYSGGSKPYNYGFAQPINVSANPSGGSGNYSYQWSISSGGGTLSNATSQTATVTQGVTPSGQTSTTYLMCVITDTVTGNTVNVYPTARWNWT